MLSDLSVDFIVWHSPAGISANSPADKTPLSSPELYSKLPLRQKTAKCRFGAG
ncbi:MAG: hypothetical protein IJW08_09535 [Lentisphaeria bacterium]|nr:hypothetical protein [Lentisphaeria bacterium]MBQ7396768.1 hypothetical protein [Lentisphaeria bacterium]MBR7120085.1 hypothetical protein [Lentisphaeria bacterium]